MIFLWILFAVIIGVILLLNLKVHFIFDCHEKFSVTLKVLFFKFDAYKLFRNFGKEKENRSKKISSTENSKTNQTIHKKIDLIGFAEFLFHIAKVISLAIREHFSKATIYLKELDVRIGTEDAAETALITSAVTQAANGLCAVLQHFSKFRCYPDKLYIAPNFTSEKSTVSFELILTSKLIDIIGVLIRTYIRFFERKEDNHARNSIKTGH